MGIRCPKCHHENLDDTLFCGKCGGPLKSAEGISVTKTFITPVDRLQKGSTVTGRYNIIKELGRGGMGVVYKAEDTKLKRTVALKFLPPELTHMPEVHERFMREAQAAAALDHPNICTVYEFDEAEDTNFISMAYIEGQSLRKKIESGPVELDEALRIAAQVAEGLQEAHKKGVVHRDIKSVNIMVTERGQAKIMDFGLARMTERTLVTQEGMTMGTIAYMSPEQAKGEKVDHRTDIWSCGVVLYEMLTGQLPFKGEHDQSVVYSILNRKSKPITELRSEIPLSIGQVVDKALEKNPDERYQQIDELLDDLKSISAGIVPEEIKIRLRKAKLRRRKRTILYTGAAGLVIVIAVLALTLFTGRAEAIDSIAVLPLQNLTGDTEKEFFVDIATEELIGKLGQISGLRRVMSRTTVMKYKETDKTLSEIARELNVDVVVEGSVQQAGDRIRIQVRLIDALPEEQNLWGQTYERAMSDVLVMYGEMAQAIADNIQVKLTDQEESRLAGARQVNPEAYEVLLIGKQKESPLTPQAFDIALEYYELALEKDPNYAAAHLAVANTWLLRNQFGYTAPREAGPKAKAAVLKALELDSTLADGHALLAWVNFLYEWDWAGAEAEWKRAIELNPNYVDSVYAHFLWIMKRPEEAMAQMERALQLDPLNELVHIHHGFILESAGRYDEAIVQMRKLLRTSPQHPMAHQLLSVSFWHKAMYEESLTEMKTYYSCMGDREVEEALTQGYAQSGYRGAMRRAADLLAARARKTYVLSVDVALLYAVAEENGQALEWLEKGLEVRDPVMPYVDAFVEFAPLRPDPRFQDLLRKMNLPVDEKE
ncbi:MAG: protein kinase [Candidatus Aminicenantes bacterium]|jgi:serine/threonine-protein kinase